jgi:hypothetical protein
MAGARYNGGVIIIFYCTPRGSERIRAHIVGYVNHFSGL